ncbi:putative baseplate assembly protein [Flexivirga alba]|uniref:Baseplate assembly protein n=1 Tax=Flexivirga alba TaxID=702742 RepID=A0ABW2AG85_9MICO
MTTVPLDDDIPVLDDHTYDSIIAEMTSRIGRYTPEWKPVWTDYNDSDPGITMLQVFAWLGEMLAYRMNQVPDLLYLKFLQLLGVELRPAEPAQVQITFPLLASAGTLATVPQGTQVIAEAASGGPPLVFEADHALVCLKAAPRAVLAYDGHSYADVTAADAAALPYRPFGPTATTGAALLIGFDATDPFPGTEITFYAWTAAASASGSPVSCGLAPTATFAPATVRWQYWDGYDWSPATLLKDDTLAFTRSGEIIVKTPDNALVATSIAPVPGSFYWLRALVDTSAYQQPPALLAIRPNTMTLTQMETVYAEVLGGSTGRRDQAFTLTQTPVLAGSLTLTVDQGEGEQGWTEVDDFYSSGPDSLHYVLNRTTGEVRFGDGIHGAIPVANASNPSANVVATHYRYGGGTSGNVPAGALHALRSAVPGIDDARVLNVQPSYGGQDEETLDSAKQRAPASIRSRCRAVTTDDFELFATEAADIARAKAMPLTHPDFPGAQIPGVVTVVVVPRSDSRKPVPGQATLRTVCAFLNERRLLTAEVYVAPPTYQQVSITVSVVADDTADLAQVQRDVDAGLLTYFDPQTGGEAGTGWPFGGTIAFSRVFHRVLSVAGVSAVEQLTITVDGVDAPPCRDVPLTAGALAYSTRHQVSVAYEVTSS